MLLLRFFYISVSLESAKTHRNRGLHIWRTPCLILLYPYLFRKTFRSGLQHKIWKSCDNLCIPSVYAKHIVVFCSNFIRFYPIRHRTWQNGSMCHYFPITDSAFQWSKVCAKGHIFSDHSALTKRPDTKTQLSPFFWRFHPTFWIFCLKITQWYQNRWFLALTFTLWGM